MFAGGSRHRGDGHPKRISVVIVLVILVGSLLASVFVAIASEAPSSSPGSGALNSPQPQGNVTGPGTSSPDPSLGVIATVPVGSLPHSAAYDSANGYLYVANYNSTNVSVVQGTSVVATVPVGSGPYSATYDSSHGYVYVPNFNSINVSVLSGTSVVGTIPVGYDPTWATNDSGNGYVYVVNSGSSNVSVLNGKSLVGTVAVGSAPSSATYDSSNGYVYVTNYVSSSVSVLSGTSVVGTVSVGSMPVAAAYDSANGDVYVVNQGSDSVSVLHGTSVVGTVSVGSVPVAATFDGGNGYVYVVSQVAESVSVLSGTTVVGTVPVGSQPVSATVDGANGYVVVVNQGSDNVTLLSGTTVVGSVPVGSMPISATYDSADSYLYVVDEGSGELSVIGTQSGTLFGVTFTETGLPGGTLWSVTLNGVKESSAGASIEFNETDGTYSYTVTAPIGYGSTITSGTVTVSGSAVTVSLGMTPETDGGALGELYTIYNGRTDLKGAFPQASLNPTSFAGLVAWAGYVVEGKSADGAYSALEPFGYWYTLMSVYDQRTDLQTAFPNAQSSSSAYAGLVAWAYGAVVGAFTDGAGTVLAPFGYYYDLMTLYGERSDLQAAFPNAYSNPASYEGLVTWAGYVVTGQSVDGANATLQPFGYYYDLMMVYGERADLQSAFPNAYSNQASYEALVTWAGHVVTGQSVDGAKATLQPFGYYYDLLMVYGQRSDLQGAYPDAYSNLASYSGLLTWAGKVVTGQFVDGANATLQPFGYYYDLMGIYGQRSDLQAAFPQAWSSEGSYAQLLTWAKEVVEQVIQDGAYAQLKVYASYYIAHG